MNVNKKYSSRNYRVYSNKSKVLLPKFLKWLKKQIELENKKCASNSKEQLLCQLVHVHSKMLFILPETFDRYYKYSGIPAKIIQTELKKALMITFTYTVIRKEKIIEVFPCQLFNLKS